MIGPANRLVPERPDGNRSIVIELGCGPRSVLCVRRRNLTVVQGDFLQKRADPVISARWRWSFGERQGSQSAKTPEKLQLRRAKLTLPARHPSHRRRLDSGRIRKVHPARPEL